MAKTRFDGVIEAVRYTPEGKIDVVRAYQRRGTAFSDHVLISRARLVERLQQGEKFITGQRKELLGGSFETGKPVALLGEHISTGTPGNRDLLEDVPLF